MPDDKLKQLEDLVMMRDSLKNALHIKCRMFGMVGWAEFNAVGLCNTCNTKVMDACVKISINHMHLCENVNNCGKCNDYNGTVYNFCEEIKRVRDDESSCIPYTEKLSLMKLNKTKRRQMFSFKEEKSEISENKIDKELQKYSDDLDKIMVSSLKMPFKPDGNRKMPDETSNDEQDITFKKRIADNMGDFDLPPGYTTGVRSYLNGIGESYGRDDEAARYLVPVFTFISQFDRRIFGLVTYADEDVIYPLFVEIERLLEDLSMGAHTPYSAYHNDTWTRLHDVALSNQLNPFRWRLDRGTIEEIRGVMTHISENVTLEMGRCTDECVMHVAAHFAIMLIVNEYNVQQFADNEIRDIVGNMDSDMYNDDPDPPF